MTLVGAQDVWKTGTRVYVIESTDGPLLDLGTIDVVSPNMEVEEARLEDSDGGIRKTILREVTKLTERYDVTLFNLNMRNLRYLFYSEDVVDYSQSSAQTTTIPLPLWEANKVKIKNGNGDFVYNLNAVDAIRNGSTTVVGATLYEVDLARGIITFGNTTSYRAATDGQLGEIDYTSATIADGARLLRPQSKEGNFSGTIILVWGRGNNQQQTVREFTGTIIPAAGAFSDSEYSNFPVSIEVEADIDETEPAGRLLYFKGTTPVVDLNQ